VLLTANLYLVSEPAEASFIRFCRIELMIWVFQVVVREWS